jgi:RNA polymerase sigma-70 factor (ECF subfamily)
MIHPSRGSSNQSAFVADAELLFALHRQGVFRYLCRVVGRADTAQDLTQEVFLRVTRTRVPDADPSGHRAWVFKIARNLVLNHVRDGVRRGEAIALVDSATPATQELAVAIKQAVGALAEADRDVFLLRESAGLSYGEIAVACDLTTEAVRARLKRAREQLRHALDGPMRVGRQGAITFRRTDPGEGS